MKPLSLSRPYVIVMVGIPGSGKSFFGDHFASTFGAPLINRSKLQAELFGQVTTDSKQAAITQKVGLAMLSELFKTKHTIIYEGDSSTKASRRELSKMAQDAGYGILFVWLQTESYEASRRAMLKTASPRLTKQEFDDKVREFVIPDTSERPVVISGKHTYASQLKVVLKHLTGGERIEVHDEPRKVVTPASRSKLIR